MFFTTDSQSKYEVYENSIRRVSGSRAPTSRQGNDGEWKQFYGISDVAIGYPVIITWSIDDVDGHQAARNTVTNVVNSIDTTEE